MDRGVGAVEARQHPVGAALEHHQTLHPRRDLGDELDRAGGVADHGDGAAGEIEIVVPARRVEALAAEPLEPPDRRDVRPVQLSHGGDQDLRGNLLAGGGAPGTNYDGIIVSGGASFAERFDGQTLSASGDFDVLSGSPNDPLALQTGAAGENLDVFDNVGTQVLGGVGTLGFPNPAAIGEGSFAVLFTFDQ